MSQQRILQLITAAEGIAFDPSQDAGARLRAVEVAVSILRDLPEESRGAGVSCANGGPSTQPARATDSGDPQCRLVAWVQEKNLHLTCRFGNLEGRWLASIPNAEVRRARVLECTCGRGLTPGGALEDYARRISGRDLVMDAYTNRRRELSVPDLIGEVEHHTV